MLYYLSLPYLLSLLFVPVIIIDPEPSFVNKTCVLPMQINGVTWDRGENVRIVKF